MRLRIHSIQGHVVGAGWRNYVIVEVRAGDLVGWGEATVEGRTWGVMGALRDITPYFIGEDAFRAEHLWQRVYRHSFWRGGVVDLSALSGVEQALWDLRGKALGLPVYELLGGRVRDRVRVYANGPRGTTPDEVAKSARSLVDRGFRALKWAPFPATPIVGGDSIAQGVAQVRAVREAVGPEVELLIDVHGRLTPAQSVRAAAALEEFDITFLEEPVLPENVDALAQIAPRIRIPIATGERLFTRWGFREVLEKGAAAVIQPDLAHCGGIAEGRKIAAMAETYYVGVAPHNPLSYLNTAASLHLDAAIPNFVIQEFVADPEPWKEAIVREPIPLQSDGTMLVPDRPGLGVEFDPEAARRFPPVESTPPPLFHADGSVADW